MSSPPATDVFEPGKNEVRLIQVEPEKGTTSSVPSPPKPVLIATPCEEGEYPVLVLLHGYLLYNSFYSQLMQHIASHGFIVVAPQLYLVAGADSTEEINSAAAVTDWLSQGLSNALPQSVQPNLTKVAVSGHSRGGKVAFALALGYVETKLKFLAVIGIDPVDGMGKGKSTPPPILTYVPKSFKLNMAAMVIGSGLGGVKKNPLFPPCAPEGVSHQEFFDECCAPACHLVVKDYGHTDMLDDETMGIRGKSTYCLCKNGKARKPMRVFVGGALVAFMRAYLDDDTRDLSAIVDSPETAPVALSIACFAR